MSLPTPLEKDIEKKIGEYAKKQGCLYKKYSSPSNPGVPDRILIAPGNKIAFLEIKRQGKTPTPLQEREIALLKAYGCRVTWVDSVVRGRDFIDSLLLKQPNTGENWI